MFGKFWDEIQGFHINSFKKWIGIDIDLLVYERYLRGVIIARISDRCTKDIEYNLIILGIIL